MLKTLYIDVVRHNHALTRMLKCFPITFSLCPNTKTSTIVVFDKGTCRFTCHCPDVAFFRMTTKITLGLVHDDPSDVRIIHEKVMILFEDN